MFPNLKFPHLNYWDSTVGMNGGDMEEEMWNGSKSSYELHFRDHTWGSIWLTPYSTVLLEKLIITQLVKKSHLSCNRAFHTSLS